MDPAVWIAGGLAALAIVLVLAKPNDARHDARRRNPKPKR